ncbi:hypothetical protein D3C81_1498600 [compost metagenome]
MGVVDQDMTVDSLDMTADTVARRAALDECQPLAHVDLCIATAGEDLGDAAAGGDVRAAFCGLNDHRRRHFLRHADVGLTRCCSDDQGLSVRRREDEPLVADHGFEVAVVGGNVDIDRRGMALNHHVVLARDLALIKPYLFQKDVYLVVPVFVEAMNGLAIDGRVCLLLKTAGPARNEIDGVGVHEKARLLWMGGGGCRCGQS